MTTEEAAVEDENKTEVVDLAPKQAAAAPNARGVFVPWPKKVTSFVHPKVNHNKHHFSEFCS